MLKGFMDHWVPTTSQISTFWKQEYATVQNVLDQLVNDIDFNHITFYTKWYTNGVYSQLPYLYNHPEASNTRTNNEWGKEIIQLLHQHDISVGAMIQFFTYEQHSKAQDLIMDEWDVREFAETPLPVGIADFTQPEFQVRIKDLVKEQLTQFPGLDYLFLEFEGVKNDVIQRLYEKWAAEHGYPPSDQVQYDARRVEHCSRTGAEAMDLIWSNEVHVMLKHYYTLNLQAVKEVLDELQYTGKVGIVYHAYGYEAFIYPDIVPNIDWWLLPWNYWVFEDVHPTTEEKKIVTKELMRQWKADGFKVCYIGDVTMGRNGFNYEQKEKDIRDFYQFSEEQQLEGYLGMGNPIPEIGLRWQAVTDEHVLKVRELYKELYAAENIGSE